MHVKEFLHKLLSSVIHINRLNALSCVVEAAVLSKNLTLTAMGRAINLPIQERSGIQKVNRLLRNKHLLNDYLAICKAIAEKLIGQIKTPTIIVDWTKYPNSDDSVLRASIGVKGRSITLYEERHREKSVGNRSIQNKFLLNIKKIIPNECTPIIVTDAGFHAPWFKQVLKMKWDYIGRIRGRKMYMDVDGAIFYRCSDLHKQAKKQVKDLGKKLLTKNNRFETNLYLIKFRVKGRKSMVKKRGFLGGNDERDYSKLNREPWLLASSLEGPDKATCVVSMYKARMSIEEGFRDLKSKQYGMNLEGVKTKKGIRKDIMLIVSMLCNLVAVLTGVAGEAMNLHFQFQSNSIKNRRVLSIFFLGCRLIKRKAKIPMEIIQLAINSLKKEVVYN